MRLRQRPAVNTYVWDDELKRVVIAAVGMNLDLYPGLGFPGEPKEESETAETVGYLTSLLNCTSEVVTANQDPYYEHLSMIGSVVVEIDLPLIAFHRAGPDPKYYASTL